MVSLEKLRGEATVLQWNARGLRNRLADFRQFVFKYQFLVIAISESRVSHNTRLSGYELYHSHGGNELSRVLLGVRKDLTFVQHNIPPHPTNQYIAATIRKAEVSFTVIAGYIPPRAPFDVQRLDTILQQTPSPHILTGDFNSHHASWGSKKNNTRGHALFDLTLKHDLVVLNDGSPTYFRGASMSSPLDVSFASSTLSGETTWFADIETHGSDHVPTYTTIQGMHCTKRRTTICYTD